MGFTLILVTLDGLDVGLLGDVIGEDDCDDDETVAKFRGYYPHLDNGIYNVFDRVMRPFALKQTRKPQSDHENARHSVSSTSAHHNYGSLSHQGDDDEDDGA
ncbi:hypothetical protein Tco_0862570 [Tanacetum coccineum]